MTTASSRRQYERGRPFTLLTERTVAIKRVLAWQIEKAMRDGAVSKTEMARRMNTSRSQLDRLLDPENHAVSLETLARAAHAVGRSLKLDLV